MVSHRALGLLVPGFYVYLAVDLALLHLQRRRAEDLGPVRVFAGLVERHALGADDLVLDAVRHRPTAHVAQVLGDLRLAVKHLGGARGSVAVDGSHLGVVSVEAYEQLGIEVLDGLAQGLEIEPPEVFCAVIERLLLLCVRSPLERVLQE